MTKEQWINDFRQLEAELNSYIKELKLQYSDDEVSHMLDHHKYEGMHQELIQHPVNVAEVLQDNRFNMTDTEFMEAVQTEYDNLMSNEYIAQNLSFKTFEQLVHNM